MAPMASFEDSLQKSMFAQSSEKTFIDKILAKDEVDKIRTIIKKPNLQREDIIEILYLLSGTESKLLNYGEWDRYVILKFFVWLREFVKVAELLYDYQDDLRMKSHTCVKCKKLYKTFQKQEKECECENPKPIIEVSERTKKLLYNNERLIEHNVKFLIDLYVNIARTTLSIGATGILELLKNKFEVDYKGQGLYTQAPQQEKGGLLKLKK